MCAYDDPWPICCWRLFRESSHIAITPTVDRDELSERFLKRVMQGAKVSPRHLNADRARDLRLSRDELTECDEHTKFYAFEARAIRVVGAIRDGELRRVN